MASYVSGGSLMPGRGHTRGTVTLHDRLMKLAARTKRESHWQHVERRAIERRPHTVSEQHIRDVLVPMLRRHLHEVNKRERTGPKYGEKAFAGGRLRFVYDRRNSDRYIPRTVLRHDQRPKRDTALS